MKIQCCVCGQFQKENKEWDGFKRHVGGDGISFGYCPVCFKSEKKRIKKELKKYKRREIWKILKRKFWI